MKQIVWYFLAPVVIAAVVLFSCENSNSPTAPSQQRAPEAMVMAPNQTTQPTQPTGGGTSGTKATATIWTNGESVYTKIENTGNKATNYVFVCYEDPTGQIGDQIMLEPYHQINLAGSRASGRLGLRMPLNEDGDMCAIQCDTVDRKTPKAIPHYTEAELLTYAHYGEGLCEHPCEGDCDPNECTKGPDPSGPGLECEWMGDEICKWGCKCIPTTEPECPEQRWDYESCSWVGGCLCEPVGEKECPIQVWDPKKCEWVGDCGCTLECDPGEHLHPETCDCWCDPVGEPECAEQTWNEKKCQWEGDCECEPIGEPECDEQTWDPIKCKWVGDCPCPPQQCDIGYEWNEDRCKCEAKGICHVSNKGGDGDWNIQEQDKKYSPGHGGHMNISSFCPPDYFGKCDGRYNNQPNMCQ